MTSITHWCNWLLINDPSITHILLYCARKTLSLLSCTICFCLWFFYLSLTHFFLYLKFLLTMSRRKVLITNTDDSQLCNLKNWTTLTGQPSRCGSTTNGKEIMEKILKLKDVRAHCYCASLVRKLYMTWRVPRHVLLVFSVTPFKIDQNKKSKPCNR